MIIKKTKSLRFDVDVGPVIDERQIADIEQFVRDSIEKGAKVLVGGKRVTGRPGYYYEPTVLTGLNSSMRIMNEECFGPILPITVVEDEKEAVKLANESNYGLGASIWTGEISRAVELAKELHVGMVWVNDVNVAFVEAPWGGVKGSGQGFELSPDCLLEYVVRKHLSVEKSSEVRRIWWYPYS
ncbi:MAG: aldehyde dehydrogenase family protein [Proteobacteria bacterium]|nr:aldehyde dehydrogenase family protein [Pseudomonadota bacterium]